MPYVQVQIAGKLTEEQKQQLSQEITETIERVTGKPRGYTYLSIQEVERENFAIGGELLSRRTPGAKS